MTFRWPWEPEQPFPEPVMIPAPQVMVCPECNGKHYFALRKIRTDAIEGGKHISRETGNECICLNPKCGYIFATTDEGVKRLPQPSIQRTQTSTELPKLPDPPTGAEKWTPRERKSGV